MGRLEEYGYSESIRSGAKPVAAWARPTPFCPTSGGGTVSVGKSGRSYPSGLTIRRLVGRQWLPSELRNRRRMQMRRRNSDPALFEPAQPAAGPQPVNRVR